MMSRLHKQHGFTLVELVIVIVIVGIIASVATKKMTQTVETAQYENTKQEMEHLAFALVGNPAVYANGTRSDFGYVGDVGALPPDLDALVSNPGGYSTWAGPYMGSGYNEDDFKKDAWGEEYVLSDTLLRSTGSGSNIDKVFAPSTAALTSNTVRGFVVDANHDVPGSEQTTTLTVCIIYPDGAGDTTSAITNPDDYGNFLFSGIPIGAHQLKVIYEPENDTATFSVSVEANSTSKLSITFPADLW